MEYEHGTALKQGVENTSDRLIDLHVMIYLRADTFLICMMYCSRYQVAHVGRWKMKPLYVEAV